MANFYLKGMIISLISCSFLTISVFAQNSAYDKLNEKARKYYSRENSENMPDEKVAFLNWYYTKSFYVDRENSPQCNTGLCADLKDEDIDIKEYEFRRLQSERKKLVNHEPSYYIVLLSKDEVDAMKKQLSHK